MEITKSINSSLLSLFCFVIPVTVHCQIYTLSTPISGSLTMSAQDVNGPAGSSRGFNFTFTNLTETVYLDPVAETIRQVGVISGLPTATNISIQETQSIPGQFQNPPTNVSGSVTVTLAPIGGVLSFDTGVHPLTWNSASGAYTCYAFVLSLNNCVGSYSLVAGGQTYTGSFTYGLSDENDERWPSTFNTVSTVGYPNSLALSGVNNWTVFATSPSVVADVLATDGFHIKLTVGVYNDGDDIGEMFTWNSPGTITATLVTASNAPAITAQPQSVVVHAQNPASFSVTASGTIPLSYQWSFNGTNISGATLSSLTISNVVQTNLGTYAVLITNGVGSVTSSNAMLSMYPFINVPFTGATTYWGKPATFGIQAWGTGPLSYQWFKDGLALFDATNQTLTFTSTQATNAGLYSVVVTSSLGSATNAAAEVIVYPAGVSLGFCPSVTISGVIGYSYIIQSTIDLTNTNSWATLTNFTLTQPVQLWVDTSVDATSPANSRYFYRVLSGQ